MLRHEAVDSNFTQCLVLFLGNMQNVVIIHHINQCTCSHPNPMPERREITPVCIHLQVEAKAGRYAHEWN